MQSSRLHPLSSVDWAQLRSSAELRARFAAFRDVYFGFALTSANYNIIALRGTRPSSSGPSTPRCRRFPCHSSGITTRNSSWRVFTSAFLCCLRCWRTRSSRPPRASNSSLPCLVTGHSLGAALAVLTSPTVDLLTANNDVRMYNFAGPRVGNPAFAGAYSEFVAQSYRVVNLTDVVPFLPPTQIFGWDYAHVGEEWSFLNQSGNVTWPRPRHRQQLHGSGQPAGAHQRAAHLPVTGLGNSPAA